MQGVEMTEAEIYALPVVMTFKQAARAHGIGPKLALQMKAAGTLPFPVRQQGRSWVTTKSELLESLHMPLAAQAVEPRGQGAA